MEFLNRQYARLWAEIERQRFDRDLKAILRAVREKNLPEGATLEGFDEQWQQLADLFSAVEWSTLARREFAAALKLGSMQFGFPSLEFVMLMMPPAEKVADDFAGLAGIFKAVAELSPQAFTLTSDTTGPLAVHKLTVTDAPFPLTLTLARHEDVIVVGLGPTLVEQSLALLRGQGGQTLTDSSRFREAFAQLPPPTDGLTFVDCAQLFGQLRALCSELTAMLEAGAPPEGEPGHEQFAKWKALPPKVLDLFDLWEYVAEVRTTDGMVTTTDAVALLRADAQSRGMYPVLYGNPPLREPLKYVPRNAGDFWVWSGLNFPELYKLAVEFIRKEIPDGEALIAKLEDLRQPPAAEGQAGGGIGLDLEKDVFGWIGGSLVTFSVPGPTVYAPAEFVVMLSVRDEAKAREMIGRLLALLEPLLQGGQGAIVDVQVEGAEGFKSVQHPMLAMLPIGQPTIGVKDGWLFFASGPGIINKALQVAAGQEESLASNERFQKEGLPPEGRVRSLSFTDQTKLGEELSQMLMMAPMVGMMVPDVARDRAAQRLLTMIGKAGRVVRKLDFLQSSASRTTLEGRIERTRSVMNYREPPAPPEPKAPTGEPQPEGKTPDEQPSEEQP